MQFDCGEAQHLAAVGHTGHVIGGGSAISAAVRDAGRRQRSRIAINTPSASSDTCLAKVVFLRDISFLSRPSADIDIEARGDKDTRCEALAFQFENSQRKHRHLPLIAMRVMTTVQASTSLS